MRVVLVRLSALGDIVHTWPLANAIHSAAPQVELCWAVEEPLRPLVDGHPAVHSVITVATRRWRTAPLSAVTRADIARIRRAFAELQPALCLDPQGTLKSAMVARLTGAPERIGLAKPWRREALPGLVYNRVVDGSRDHRHVVATNLQMMRGLGLEPPAEVVQPDGRWLAERVRDQVPQGAWNRRYAVLLPAAGHPAKIMPVSTLVAVARGLIELRLDVVVAWGPAERPRAEAVASLGGTRVFLAPATDLCQLTALLAGAAVVVGGDTGPVHLAASVGVPTVAAFLSTDWRRNGPLGRRVRVVSGAAERASGPTGSAHARPVRQLAAAEVIAAAAAVLGVDNQAMVLQSQ